MRLWENLTQRERVEYERGWFLAMLRGDIGEHFPYYGPTRVGLFGR